MKFEKSICLCFDVLTHQLIFIEGVEIFLIQRSPAAWQCHTFGLGYLTAPMRVYLLLFSHRADVDCVMCFGVFLIYVDATRYRLITLRTTRCYLILSAIMGMFMNAKEC